MAAGRRHCFLWGSSDLLDCRAGARGLLAIPLGGRQKSMRLLLTVQDTFMIARRGLLVVPEPPVDSVRGPGEFLVELRTPHGSRVSACLTLSYKFVSPPEPVKRWACTFRDLDKGAVPVGTEIWCDDDLFSPAHRSDAE